ncbi:MAG: class I SAM-dependent rRNA methyltransferase [Pseudomonadota bacterium]
MDRLSEPSSARAIVKLRPGKGRRLAEGAPWAFADEIALDRRTRKLAAGSLVQLVDGERSLGVAAFNADSRIAARLLDTDSDAEIGRDWLVARLAAAAALRQRLYGAPFYRLVHAEGDGLPGVVIDRFGEAAVIQPNAAWADRLLPDLVSALVDVTGVGTVVVNATSRVRKLEGLDEHLEVAQGTLDGPIEVPMNGALYLAELMGGQKTGLFYDQRPNHAFVAGLAQGARVLDVFAHVGGFGLACLAGGAAEVTAVDSSAPALELAGEGATRMGLADRFSAQKSDAFAALEAHAGANLDIVICDPPAFAPNRVALAQGLRAYQKVARLAAGAVAPGGLLVLCSCSHAAGAEAFHKACIEGIRGAGRSGALIHSGRAGPDHPVHIGLPETGYLKALVFRLT